MKLISDLYGEYHDKPVDADRVPLFAGLEEKNA